MWPVQQMHFLMMTQVLAALERFSTRAALELIVLHMDGLMLLESILVVHTLAAHLARECTILRMCRALMTFQVGSLCEVLTTDFTEEWLHSEVDVPVVLQAAF